MKDKRPHNLSDSYSPASAGFSVMSEPIAALSTAPGAAAIAVVRLSGPGSFELLEPLLIRRSEAHARMMMMAKFIDPASGEEIDELMVALFVSPQSFTGEDSAELFCHGGPYIVQRILQTLFANGFRQAEPGEYTRRAFLNGKMDLSSAEGVKQLVEAGTHQQWIAARQLATGRFSETIEELRSRLIGALAFLAARIDFPDEGDTQDVALETVVHKVRGVSTQLQKLEASYESGRVAAQGLMVAIIGQPNMGKSTLMNTLLGHERAIVSEQAGTTRDYLEEPCRVRGRLIRLIDTAGVRETLDSIEQQGVARALQLAEQADLVLLLVGSDEGPEAYAEIEKIATQIGSNKCLRIQTKADLRKAQEHAGYIAISAMKDHGLDLLEAELVKRVDGYVGQLNDQPFVSSARHHQAIQDAKLDLENFFEGVKAGAYDEMLAFELQNATRALGGILGVVDVEDILDKVFHEFCVGK
ncbi:MAG: tRNA uridine-5-carboxymethylaminomethyl(34) synthesis GTPase MnmE [Proteobacteria bacterium]|nr:MAG: tRNA uridine-5-carboxymethylaminomethyl(34) synthesis GTPase MnmE [Pseudomonadota bacterium]